MKNRWNCSFLGVFRDKDLGIRSEGMKDKRDKDKGAKSSSNAGFMVLGVRNKERKRCEKPCPYYQKT